MSFGNLSMDSSVFLSDDDETFVTQDATVVDASPCLNEKVYNVSTKGRSGSLRLTDKGVVWRGLKSHLRVEWSQVLKVKANVSTSPVALLRISFHSNSYSKNGDNSNNKCYVFKFSCRWRMEEAKVDMNDRIANCSDETNSKKQKLYKSIGIQGRGSGSLLLAEAGLSWRAQDKHKASSTNVQVEWSRVEKVTANVPSHPSAMLKIRIPQNSDENNKEKPRRRRSASDNFRLYCDDEGTDPSSTTTTTIVFRFPTRNQMEQAKADMQNRIYLCLKPKTYASLAQKLGANTTNNSAAGDTRTAALSVEESLSVASTSSSFRSDVNVPSSIHVDSHSHIILQPPNDSSKKPAAVDPPDTEATIRPYCNAFNHNKADPPDDPPDDPPEENNLPETQDPVLTYTGPAKPEVEANWETASESSSSSSEPLMANPPADFLEEDPAASNHPVFPYTGPPKSKAAFLDDDQRRLFEIHKPQALHANIWTISGCEDQNQTSADVSNVAAKFQLPDPQGRASGACSAALLNVLYQQDEQTPAEKYSFGQVMDQMRTVLKQKGFSQVPQLSSTQPIDMNQDFDLVPDSVTGQRRAVLIGINYVGQKGELKGCHNDVRNVSKYIQKCYGFKDEDIELLVDDGKHTRPTKQAIIAAYQQVVQESQAGDSIFIHFSGHGTKKKDWNGDKDDGYDEALVPLDFKENGVIIDDDIYDIFVKGLPPGVHVVALFDFCHSGTVMDLPYVFKGNGEYSRMEIEDNFNSGKLFSKMDPSYVRKWTFGADDEGSMKRDSEALNKDKNGFIDAMEAEQLLTPSQVARLSSSRQRKRSLEQQFYIGCGYQRATVGHGSLQHQGDGPIEFDV